MNYRSIYERLIARARERVLVGYRERHHVLPRCLGGTDAPSNLVELTPEEHYVAHQLLVKMHRCHSGLEAAANLLAKRCSGNKAYGWIRRRLAHTQALAMHGNRIGVGNKNCAGRVLNAETLRKMAAAKLGKPGPVHGPEARAKMSAAQANRVLTQQGLEKIRATSLGRRHSAETRAKMSAAHIGRKQPPELVAKRRESLLATLRSRAVA